MNLESFLNVIIKKIQGVDMTSSLAFSSVFSFIFLLVAYHWSGLSEKVENLTTGKKIIVFAFITVILVAFYYIFYKAGKFDRLLTIPIINDSIDKIIYMINRLSKA